MTINLSPELEAALKARAEQRGTTPEELAVEALQQQFLKAELLEPQDDWERRLRAIASPCGANLSHEAVSSEGLYE